MDQLEITALTVSTKIGIHAWEQKILQKLVIDIILYVDLSKCQNNLENTIDYDHLCTIVTTYLETNSFTLIETVAEKVYLLIKEEFKVGKIAVKVCKPGAIKNAQNVCVQIIR